METGGDYELYYTNDLKHIKNKKLASLSADDTVNVNNMKFVLNKEFIKESRLNEYQFRIKKFEKAISDVRNLVSYQWLDRYGINLEITARHKSPESAAKIANDESGYEGVQVQKSPGYS